MNMTPQQRYFMIVGRLVVEDEMEAEQAIQFASVLHAAFIKLDEQDKFETDVRRTIEAL